MGIFSIIIIVSLLLALGSTIFAPVAAAGEVSVSIGNAPDTVTEDVEFTVTVDISQVVDINGAQYEIVFNPSVLRLDDVITGEIDSTGMPVQGFAEVSPGSYRVLQSLIFDKISGSGYLAVLHFHVIGSLGDSSSIDLSNGTLSGWEGEIPATWIGDSVSIVSAESDRKEPALVAPSSPEATSAKPVNWPVLWGVIVGVLVVGLLIFLQVRRRPY
ncbi:cohesin domain-containing protein [Chloroflexota bacterium]